MAKVANEDAIEDIQKMHQGLHIAMDHLIKDKDVKKAEEILRQLDLFMTDWINQTKVIK